MLLVLLDAVEIFKYLTRDYNDGFINDRVKYGSGKI